MKNKKRMLTLFMGSLAFATSSLAQSNAVKMLTNLEAGSPMTLIVNTCDTPYVVDWGDGNPVKYQSDQSLSYLEIKGEVKGQNVSVGNDGDWFLLDCSNNHLTSIDLTAALQLRSLYCHYNELTALSLKGMKNLVELNCSHNLLKQFDFTDINNQSKDLEKIENLNMSYNQFAGTYSYRLPNLQYLKINNNAFTKIYMYDENLRSLDVSNNQINGILTLAKCLKLENVVCHGNKIAFLNILDKGAQIYQVVCDNNKLRKVDLTNATHLSVLSAADNQLISCPVAPSAKISSMNISNNALDFTALPSKEKAPTYVAFEPQAPIDMSKVTGMLTKDTLLYAPIAQSWADRVNTNIDLSAYCKDAGGEETVDVAVYSVKGSNVPLKACESEGEGDYSFEAGKFAFFHGYDKAYIELTSKSYGFVLPTTSFTIGDKITGVSTLVASEGLQVSAQRGSLVLSAQQPTHVNVFNVQGKSCWNGEVSGTLTLALPKGIYIINNKKVAL